MSAHKRSIPPSPFPTVYPGEKSAMDDKMREFAKVVIKLNEQRLLQKSFPILQQLRLTQEKIPDKDPVC